MSSILLQCQFLNKNGTLNLALIFQFALVIIGAVGLIITIIKLMVSFLKDKIYLNAQYEMGNQVYLNISTRSSESFTIERICYRNEVLPVAFPYVLASGNPISLRIPDQGLFDELMAGNSKVVVFIKVTHKRTPLKRVVKFKEIAPVNIFTEIQKIWRNFYNRKK